MVTYKQDMPPPGGYSPITYTRTPMSTWKLGFKLAMMSGITVGGFILHLVHRDRLNMEKIEMRCAKIAIQPMLEAETDRALLKQFKKNRADEERVMKDVPGWEVGKFEKYPVFLSLGPDDFFKPSVYEYFAHTDKEYIRKALRVTKLF